MILNDTNFAISSTTGDGNAFYKGSAILDCIPKVYRVSASSTNGVVTVSADGTTYGSTADVTYNKSVYYKINPDVHYYYSSTSYYHDHPYSAEITLNTGNFTLNESTSPISASKAFSACIAITYTVTASASNSTNLVGESTSDMKSSLSLTYQSKTIYLRQTPNTHYEVLYSGSRYYNGNAYTTSVNLNTFTFNDANRTATYSLTNCSLITYVVTASGTNAVCKVGTTAGDYQIQLLTT